MAWTILTTLFFAAFFQFSLGKTPVFVNTTKGPIVGMTVAANTSTTNTEYDAFLGVPYGNKPERFQLAEARTAWTDLLTTQSDGLACPQPHFPSSEDCLFLNVYTPSKASSSSSKLPVLVFVPGGAFTYGSGSSKQYGPDFLVSGGIILITVNYRVGAAGFLSLGSKVAPGNLGLHDTLLALQWVQDEISAFGGDPTQVTISGGSAGAVITHFHYISPLSIKLFQRAIGQSGSAMVKWGHVTSTEARRRALLLAQRLNCDTSQNDKMILTCLQKADIKDIVGNQFIPLPEYDIVVGNPIPFVPVLDTNETAGKPFFSDSLENLMKAAETRAKPLISGFTSDEGILMFSAIAQSAYLVAEAKLPAFLPEGERNTDKVKCIQKQYFNPSPTLNKIQGLVSIYTDYAFAYPTIQVTRKFANFTYGYVFAYDGPWAETFFPRPSQQFYEYKMKGVAHGDDLSYLFYKSQSLDMCTANINNVNMKNNMVKWWTNFVKTGIPGESWPTVTEGGYFIIDTQTSIKNVTEFESQYYNFWASMHAKTTSSAISVPASILTSILSLIVIINYYF